MKSDFGALALSPDLVSVVGELGYETLTQVQAESIPPLLEARDVIGQSRTGSGKTAAFVLPILERVNLSRRSLQSVILCPTRELCAQVARETRKLGRRHKGLQVLVVSGGEPIRPQVSALSRGVHIVVGTPGRVLDHLGRKTLKLNRVKTIVLDEADRMLDMGFQEDMEKILSETPKSRQTVFFSATFPPSIEAMSRAHQKNVIRVTVEEPDEGSAGIRQIAIEVQPEQRVVALCDALAVHPHESALIFCNFKASVAGLAEELIARGVSTDCLHGDLEQFDRTHVSSLVATDRAVCR